MHGRPTTQGSGLAIWLPDAPMQAMIAVSTPSRYCTLRAPRRLCATLCYLCAAPLGAQCNNAVGLLHQPILPSLACFEDVMMASCRHSAEHLGKERGPANVGPSSECRTDRAHAGLSWTGNGSHSRMAFETDGGTRLSPESRVGDWVTVNPDRVLVPARH